MPRGVGSAAGEPPGQGHAMTDIMSRSARSRLMAAVRPKGNASTEVALARLLRSLRLRGWRRHAALPGTPDFVFPAVRIAIFADGCFWHGCPWHYTEPASRAAYWTWKVADNRRRDQRVLRALRRLGWSAWRVKECQIRSQRLPSGLLQLLRSTSSGNPMAPPDSRQRRRAVPARAEASRTERKRRRG